MEPIVLKITFDDSSDIHIQFDVEDECIIKTTGDIDLTDFVTRLANIMDEDKEIDIEKIEIDDAKLSLIQNTIIDIVGSYNKAIKEEEIDEEDVF